MKYRLTYEVEISSEDHKELKAELKDDGCYDDVEQFLEERLKYAPSQCQLAEEDEYEFASTVELEVREFKFEKATKAARRSPRRRRIKR